MKKILSIVFLLCIFTATYAQPANDEPCGAIMLTANAATTLPTTCTPTTVLTWVGATTSATTPVPTCGWGITKKDVWYKITVPDGVDSILINTLAGTGATPTTDAVMALYFTTTCAGTYTQIACVDDLSSNPMPLMKAAIPNAGVYYLRIFDFNPSITNGDMKICINLKLLHPTIDPSKRVGIGTANPEYNLDVNGTTKVRSDLTIDNITKTKDLTITNNVKIEGGSPAIGKVLTSDAAGNATWQEKSSNGGVGFGSWGDCSMNNVSEYNPLVDDSVGSTQLGSSVAISGDFAIAGAPSEKVGSNTQQGSASVYKFNGQTWVLFQKLKETTGMQGDFFGTSVAILGNYIAVGIPNQTVGANTFAGTVNIYKYNGTSWIFLQKITDPNSEQDNYFGRSVAISDSNIIVGEPNYDIAGSANIGAACIYKFNGTSWNFSIKITDPLSQASANFGSSVSISGNNIIEGSPNSSSIPNNLNGAVSFFRYNGLSWLYNQKKNGISDYFSLGTSVSISGNYVVAGATNSINNIGYAVVYKILNTGLSLGQFIRDESNLGSYQDFFGTSVSITNDLLIIGSPKTKVGDYFTGAAFVYNRLGSSWELLQKISKPSTSQEKFGNGVSINEDTKRFIIGAPVYTNNNGKIIFGKLNL